MKPICTYSRYYRACILMLAMITGMIFTANAQLTGNPLFTGADPEIHYFNGKYYIYPTASAGKRFHAYSSTDLTNWHDEGVIFDIGPQCSWAEVNGWAPGVAYRNGKYYFYYTAEVKIGVAVGNSPVGPFTDLGYPLIGTDPFTVDIIDAMVFIDDDGQAYIYYGGSNGSQMAVRRLNPDMISFASGAVNITPPNYTEGPFILKRNGVYHLTYSNGAWYNETYNVQYATSNSPTGPWTYRGRILESNSEDKGPGHHSIIKIGDCDEYYMVYHRYENGLGGSRVVAIDRMYFNSAGLIDPVNMTNYGVQARPFNSSCSAQSIVSGGIYKLTHKGTNQCLDVINNSNQEGGEIHQYTDNGNDAQRWVITLEADGHYKLRHKGTNQVLDVENNSSQSGGNIRQWTDNGSDAQRWEIEIMSDGYCKLTHKGTNQCLDVGNNSSQPGANVHQWVDNGNNAQRWKLDLIEAPIVSGGVYRLIHKGTTQCLDVENNSDQPGAEVRQWNPNTSDAQRWIITLESDGFYKLKHKGTTQVLDVDNNSNQPGANVRQWNDNNSDAQRWKMELMPDGYFRLTHKGTNQCLDVGGNSSEPGANVIQWTDNGNAAQRWKLDLMPGVTAVNGNGDGLSANYFNGMNFETLRYSTKNTTLNMNWGNGSPNAAVNANQFSARWTGQIQPRYSGEYTFYINSDNGRRVWINNQLIIDKWVDDWNIDYSGKITLTAGQKYDIKVELFENDGGASIKFEWESSLQEREIVPTAQLYSNPLPSVTVSSNVTSATAPANFVISAAANDGNGISKVDFYNGTTLIGSDNTSPYSINWNNIAIGSYTITALATDTKGGVTLSSSILLKSNSTTTNNSPSVNITAPANNATYTAPAAITINANATDSDGTISIVQFYNGTTLVGSDNTSPYSFVWNNVAAGTYTITARATDNSGATTTSSAITVKVNVVTNPCSGIAQYTENGGYVAGSIVQNAGSKYQCKPYPYTGWCNGAAWAYAPGTGAYWIDAWTLTGSCNTRMEADATVEQISFAPNPASNAIEIITPVPAHVTIVNSLGNVVLEMKEVANGTSLSLENLSSGIYLVKIDTGVQLITQTMIKK